MSASVGLPVSRIAEEAARLGVTLVVGEAGLHRRIEDSEVQKPGLQWAGLQTTHAAGIHVLGTAETALLAARSSEEQRTILVRYVQSGVPCVVVCRGLVVPPIMLELAEEENIPVFQASAPTAEVIRTLSDFLIEGFAKTVVVHGVLVQVHSLGILLMGRSGVGKSETALELMLRGHRLVADDLVALSRNQKVLVGRMSPRLGHHMEVRGLGVLHAGDLFGHAAVIEQSEIHLVIELVNWTDVDGPDRIGVETRTRTMLDLDIPELVVPVRPGRNLATIVEVAARNQLLQARGIHSALRFEASLAQALGEEEPG
ncbi:MAG: HPr(Ser) kinase/phosphatase [Myxococcota bacterium]|nr:HPr(Ser) kinase/phosphatase [Myxococcota bacterium]